MIKVLSLLALLTPHAIALPSLSGTVLDGSKGLIDGAGITLWDATNGKGLQTSSSMGRFSLTGVTEGDYLIKIEKDGMVPAYGALHLVSDGPHEIDIVMLGAGGRSLDFIGA